MAKKDDIKNGANISFDGGIVLNDKSLKEEVKEEVKPVQTEEVASSGAIGPEIESPVVSDTVVASDFPTVDPVDPLTSFNTPSYEENDKEVTSDVNNDVMPSMQAENQVNIVISSPQEWKKYIDDLYRTKPQELVKEEVERIGGKQAELVGYLVNTLNEVADKHGVPTDVHKKLEEINEMDSGKKSIDEVINKNSYSDQKVTTPNFNFPYYGEDDSYSRVA